MLKQVRWIPMAVALVGLAAAAGAADSPEGTLITDPGTLASMGFPKDAIVYVGNPSDAAGDPQPYGGVDPIMYPLSGLSFVGRQSTYAYDTGGGHGDVAFVGGDTFADAQLHLPAGALLENARVWVNDVNGAQNVTLFMFRSCLPPGGPGAPSTLQLASGNSTGSGGDQSFVLTPPAGTVIDNNGCIYWVRVRFDAAGLILRKVRAQYRLQVSPAPGVASFPNDVPTTHPFFRFVEAMAASGLTGGCAPNSFCPDSPVTRGQLSVFLSTALGLHFPN